MRHKKYSQTLHDFGLCGNSHNLCPEGAGSRFLRRPGIFSPSSKKDWPEIISAHPPRNVCKYVFLHFRFFWHLIFQPVETGVGQRRNKPSTGGSHQNFKLSRELNILSRPGKSSATGHKFWEFPNHEKLTAFSALNKVNVTILPK